MTRGRDLQPICPPKSSAWWSGICMTIGLQKTILLILPHASPRFHKSRKEYLLYLFRLPSRSYYLAIDMLFLKLFVPGFGTHVVTSWSSQKVLELKWSTPPTLFPKGSKPCKRIVHEIMEDAPVDFSRLWMFHRHDSCYAVKMKNDTIIDPVSVRTTCVCGQGLRMNDHFWSTAWVTSGIKHAHPGSSTHIRVQARKLCHFKHAHPGFRPSSIFVFSCVRKTTKSYFWTTQFLNARKRRQKHELLARSWEKKTGSFTTSPGSASGGDSSLTLSMVGIEMGLEWEVIFCFWRGCGWYGENQSIIQWNKSVRYSIRIFMMVGIHEGRGLWLLWGVGFGVCNSTANVTTYLVEILFIFGTQSEIGTDRRLQLVPRRGQMSGMIHGEWP